MENPNIRHQEIEDLVERIKSNILEARTKAKPRMPKERPTRVIYSQRGNVLLVEWKCPVCKGKPGWKGCLDCKSKGVMDGIQRAIYEEQLLVSEY